MSSSRHPTQILILVNVTFPLGSPPQYTYLAFDDGSKAEKVTVGPGTQIGWFVRVQAGAGWSRPAYTLAFDDSSILGTGSISVPNGGSSGFFTVQALSGGTKYTLAVSGIIPVSDPEIQVDPNGVLGKTAASKQYNVRWIAATNAMDVDNGSGHWTPFPAGGLPVAFGDKVQFFAVITPPADFEIDFPSGLNNHVWASPFDLITSRFPSVVHGSNEYTADLIVGDKSDPPTTQFIFIAALTDGSLQSAGYTFILS